ncbi:MAG: PQQ-binding-like beta-propeller repeat protein [Bacteroidota bacterium]
MKTTVTKQRLRPVGLAMILGALIMNFGCKPDPRIENLDLNENIYEEVYFVSGTRLKGVRGRLNGTETAMKTMNKFFEFPISGYELIASPAISPVGEFGFRSGRIHEGLKLLMGANEKFYVFDMPSENIEWEFDLMGLTNATPAVLYESTSFYEAYFGKHYAYLGTDQGVFYCLDIENKELVWQQSAAPGTWFIGDARVYHYRSPDPLADDRYHVVVSTSDGTLYQFDALTGEVEYSIDAGVTTVSQPAYSHGKVFVNDISGNISAINANNGSLAWTVSLPATTNGSIVTIQNDSQLYIGGVNGQFYALSQNDGSIIWDLDAGGAILATAEISQSQDGMVVRKNICFTTESGWVYQVNQEGEVVWNLDLGEGPLSNTPIYSVVSRTVYISSPSGKLTGLSTQTGEIAREFFDLGSGLNSNNGQSSPVLVRTNGQAKTVRFWNTGGDN